MSGKLVMIWKKSWLPGTETFVRAQQDSLRTWRSAAVGFYRTQSPLAREDDVLLGKATHAIAKKLEVQLFSLFGRSVSVERWIRESAPDMIHAHFLNNAKGLVEMAKRAKVPVVVTAHGSDVTGIPVGRSPRAHFSRWRARRVLRRSSLVIAVSEYIAERLVAMGAPPERVAVSYVGAEIVPVVNTERRYDIVFVGRLVCNKGARLLLEALSILKSQGMFPYVAIAGSGPDESFLHVKSRQEGLNVEFLGHVHHDSVPRLMASGRIFCAPSTSVFNNVSEAFGMVYLEAALQERPVVAFSVGGIPEAVADGLTGLLAPDGNAWALAAALRTLLVDAEMAAAMGRAGRHRVIELFDREHCTEQLENIYDRVALSD